MRSVSVFRGALGAVLSLGASAVLGASMVSCSSRVPDAPGAPVPLGASRHVTTVWTVEPSYPHDALAFLNLASADPYFEAFFPDRPGAAWRARMTGHELKAVGRLKSTIRDRFGSSLSSLVCYFYERSGGGGLAAFRERLRDPDTLARSHAAEFDQLSRALLGGWRVPGFLLAELCADLGTYLDFLERTDFEAYWRQEHEPALRNAALRLEAALATVNVVPRVEQVLGGGLESDRVVVYVGAFLRPNGINIGANRFLVEDRVRAGEIVGVAAHELIHGHVDWSAPDKVAAVAAVAGDSLVRERFARRDTGYNYNSWPVLVEEAFTKALDQIVQEQLDPESAPDPLERFWFHDGGLHPAGLVFYRMFRERPADPGTSDGLAAADWLAAEVAAGRFKPGFVNEAWRTAFGFDRPGALPPDPPLRRMYDAGDPALDALHPAYNQMLKPGQFVVFLKDWYRADGDPRDPEASRRSLAVLDRLGAQWSGRELADPVSGERRRGRYLFAGNWTTEKDGALWCYRNALYFQAD